MNGAIENAIQRIEGQIRAIKLDIEVNAKTKLGPSQAIWPWLVEYAAQSILYWRITGNDGLTAIQRIRGKCRVAPRPRFGGKVLYKISKTVKIGKAEPRWQHGVWLGSLETSDEHLSGTELGVIKARAVTSVQEEQRFDAKAIDSIKGTPWKPSTKHSGTKIRTHIEEQKEEGESEGEEEEPNEIQVEVYDEEDPENEVEDVTKQQEIINDRIGDTYSFYIKARDINKYGSTPRCPGCRFILGELAVQCGHNKDCKARIMKAMESDKEDKHRVRRWYVTKGIDTEKAEEAQDDKAEDKKHEKMEDDNVDVQTSANENKRKAEEYEEVNKRRREETE